MRSYLKLLPLLSILFFQVAFADLPMRVEAKAFDGNTFFVFYHGRDQVVNITTNGHLVTVNMASPSDFEILDPDFYNKYAGPITLAPDKKSLSFNTKDEFTSNVIINGEKLTAIKFSTDTENPSPINVLPQVTIDEDAYKISDKEIVKYSSTAKEHQLAFDLGSNDVQMAAFFRGKYLWIVFDAPRKFSLKSNNVFSEFLQIDSDNGTVLRVKVDGYSNARAFKKDNIWNLVVTKNKAKNKKSAITIKNLEGEEGVKISGDFSNNLLIEFHDPEIGDLIKVIPVKNSTIKLTQARESIDFNLLPSVLGLVVAINSDDIDIIKNKDSLKIISKHNLPSTATIPENKAVPAELVNQAAKIGTLLPIIDKKLDILNFNNNKARLILEASEAGNSGELFAKRFELAKFLFLNGWYIESLAALQLSKNTTPKEYNANLQAQFLAAVNATLVGAVDDAKDIYSELLKNFDLSGISEISLWNNYNEFLIGNSPSKIGFLNNLNKSINLYPENIYWPLALAEIDLSLLSNDLRSTETIFKELRTPKGNFANSLKYYKANYYRKKDQLNLAKQFFGDLIKKDNDPFNQVRAEMDLVKLQMAQKEITLPEAIKRLNALRFLWRGDKLEYDLLMQIASYYQAGGDSMNALRSYKYVQTAFSNRVNNFFLTSEMVKIFNGVFLADGTADNMDDFTAVALFYEFKELNPIGAQGDEVILSIARKLTNLDLLDNAIDLLRHQVKYRLSGEKRIINADHLAIILLLDKKPHEALQILDDTDKDNFKFEEYQYRLRLRAKALIDLKKYSDALSYLKEDETVDATILRREALFRAERWADYVNIVAPTLSIVPNMPIEGAQAQDVLRLAIAYYMQNNQAALQNLSKDLENSGNAELKNTADLLLTSNTPIDYRNLDKSLNVNQLQTLLGKFKNQLFDSK